VCVSPASTEPAGERRHAEREWLPYIHETCPREVPVWLAFSSRNVSLHTLSTRPFFWYEDDPTHYMIATVPPSPATEVDSADSATPVAQPEASTTSCVNCQRAIYKTGEKWYHQSSASMSCAPGIYAIAIPPLNSDEVERLKGEVERLQRDYEQFLQDHCAEVNQLNMRITTARADAIGECVALIKSLEG